MLRNSYMYLSAIALAGLITLVGCGDDDETGSGGSGGTATTTSTTSGMGGSDALTCAQACAAVHACGAENNGALCPGFAPGGTDEATFVNGPNGNDGCAATCDGNPLLLQLVNPDDCAATVANLKGASADFVASCEGSTGQGGAGGGAGGGGVGGAGGN